jgi:hypothetical protein
MKKLIFFLTILFTIGQSSCDLLGIGEDKVCGDKKEGYFYRTPHGTGFFTEGDSLLNRIYYPGGEGYRSTLILEKWVQHVCPKKHVKAIVGVSADKEGDFNVTSKVYWYLFYEVQLNMTARSSNDERTWEGSDNEIGLIQAYGDSGEGEFTIQATIDFPYQGSFEADTMYLFNKLRLVQFEPHYYEVK